ncbi:creatininase family protein [Candidatus Fermentibacterales bacterium]|nr:creatininase family protein [Candidatus Fermentibacterales bacterium]
MRLAEMTTDQVVQYLVKRSIVAIPLGSTEQHGSLGPLGCDSIVATEVVERACNRTGIVMTPAMPFGLSQNHTSFGGTVSLRASTLASVVFDIVGSLSGQGFRKFLFVSGHGGNRGPVLCGLADAVACNPDLRCRYVPYWELPGVPEAQKELFGEGNGAHGTATELSIVYHLYPDLAGESKRKIKKHPPEAPAGCVLGPEEWARRYPEGLVGVDPSVISDRAGRDILKAIVDSLCKLISEWEKDAS